MTATPMPGPHLHPVMHDVLADPAAPIALDHVRRPLPPTPPLSDPLELPTLEQCLVRVEHASVRRRGHPQWHTPARQQLAAQLLHTMLRAAFDQDMHLADFDAVADLPGLVYDAVVLRDRTAAATR